MGVLSEKELEDMPPVVCPLCTLYLEATGELNIMKGRLCLREITCLVLPNITHVNGFAIEESKRPPMAWGLEGSQHSLINRSAVFSRPSVPYLSSNISVPIESLNLDHNASIDINSNISTSVTSLSSNIDSLSSSFLKSSSSNPLLSSSLGINHVSTSLSNLAHLASLMPNQELIPSSNEYTLSPITSYNSGNNNSNNISNSSYSSNNSNKRQNINTFDISNIKHTNTDAPMLLTSESLANLPAIFQHRLFQGTNETIYVSKYLLYIFLSIVNDSYYL